MEKRVKAAWWVGEAIADLTTWQFGVSAGLGSGKTHGTYQWFHDRVIRNRACRFSASLWPTYQKIHDAAIPTYEKVLSAYGWQRGTDYRILKSPFPKLVYLRDRQPHEVHFLSAENPDKIIAVEYSHATEHEAGIISKEASENLRSRVRDPLAVVRQVIREGAPQGITNFADDFDSDSLPGWDLSSYRDHRFPGKLARRRFTVWTDDNPFIVPGYVDQLEDTYGHNPNLIKAYRFGMFCPLVVGAAYSNYFPQKHDIPDRNPDPMLDIVLTWDFNASPLAWVSLQRVCFEDYGRRVWRRVIMHEANEGHQTLDDSCVEFALKHPVSIFRETPIYIYGDRTGHARSHKVKGSDFEAVRGYLKELGYANVFIVADKAVAPEAESVDAVNRVFSHNLLLVCRRCTMTRRSFTATTWAPGVRKIHKKQGETHTHHGDAVKYHIYQVARNDVGEKQARTRGHNY